MAFFGEKVLLVCECHYDIHTHQGIHGIKDAAIMSLLVLHVIVFITSQAERQTRQEEDKCISYIL